MTYVPPPYVPPQVSTDPTDVMGRRIVAYLIDATVLGILTVALFFSTATTVKGVGPDYCTAGSLTDQSRNCVLIGDTAYRLDGVGTGGALLLALGYWAVVGVSEGLTGAFLGKRILGLRVVDAHGNPPGGGRGAARGALMIVDSTVCFLIGLLTASLTHPHRRLGDLAAGTFVVAKQSVGRPVPTAPAATQPYGPSMPYSSATSEQPQGSGFAPGTYGTSLPPSLPAAPAAAPKPSWGAAPAPPQPQWDAARNAWIVWDPARGQWLQWDAATSQWRPM